MSASPAKLRVLVLRDAGFGGANETESEVVAALGSDSSIRLLEGAAGYGEAARSVQNQELDLVIVDEVAGDPTTVIEQIEHAAPELPIVVVLDEDQAMIAQACMLAGARAYLFRPFDPADIVEVVRQVCSKEERRRARTNTKPLTQAGRLIVVHGSKGGVGATTVAVNLAVTLAKTTDQRVALVDVNLLGGDTDVALNIVTDNSIADVVAHLRELDNSLLDDTMIRHPSGVFVLPAPSQLERAEAIGGHETAMVLAACRANFDLVVVDTSSRPDEHALAALEMADLVMLVTTPEIAALKSAARFLQLGHNLGFPPEKLQLVINRLNSKNAIPLDDIEENLHHKMSYGLPSDGEPMVEAQNAGEPVVILRPRSRIGRELWRVGREVALKLGAPITAAVTVDGATADPIQEPKRSRFALLARFRSLRPATAP